MSLNQVRAIAHGVANKMRHAVSQAQAPAVFFEHVAQYATSDRFAVDQHAIAIKQYSFKSHRCIIGVRPQPPAKTIKFMT